MKGSLPFGFFLLISYHFYIHNHENFLNSFDYAISIWRTDVFIQERKLAKFEYNHGLFLKIKNILSF